MSINISKLFNNLELIAKEKDIQENKVIEILKYALEKAYLKENPDVNVVANIDAQKKIINLSEIKTVVDKSEDEIDDDKEVNINDVISINKDIKIGDEYISEINLNEFERRSAVHVLQIFQQKLNEESNLKIYDIWKDKINSVIRAEVEKSENKYVEVNLDSTMGIVLKGDQIPNEELIPGNKYLFLIKEIKEQSKGWPVVLSRTSPKLIESLLKLNIPDINDGVIDIKMIARIPGFKTKVAVYSNNPNIDAVGTCVGFSGERIKNISTLVNNEKIDIFLYDNDYKQMIVNMCGPEKIIGLEISDDSSEENPYGKIVTIICKDEDLLKIIGRNGINVKLMSMLTKWSIDVQPLSIAIEDKIEYEDVSHLTPIKYTSHNKSNYVVNTKENDKKPTTSKTSNKNKSSNKNNHNNNKNFTDEYDSFDYSKTQNYWDFDVTDEDVENLLKNDIVKKKKKQQKNIEDEEVIFVSKTESDSLVEQNDVVQSNDHAKSSEKEIQQAAILEKEKTEREQLDQSINSITPVKPKVSIDEFFDSMDDSQEKNKKAKKSSKSSQFKKSNETKKPKVKIDILDEFDVTENDYDDSSDIDIDDIDYEDF